MTTFGSAGRSLIGSNERWDRSAIQNFTGVDPRTTPWCAYFVSETLKSEGFPSAPSPGQVNSYRSYGEGIAGGPQVGDVAIYPTGSHVGIVTRIGDDGTPYVLSGNYSNSVREEPAPGNTIYRRPLDRDGKTPAEGGGSGRAATDAREGSGKGNTDTEEENRRKAESKGPLAKSDHDDIRGAAGNYSKGSTSSPVSRLPSREPWSGHPKAKKPDRKGFDPNAGRGDAANASAPNSPRTSGTSTGSRDGTAILNNGGATNLDRASDREKATAIDRTASNLGVNATDLATIISFETGGRMSPSVAGGGNKDGSRKGSYLGLIQFSPDSQQKYGVSRSDSFDQQMNAVESYMRDRGVKPGMGLDNMYASVLRGRANLVDDVTDSNGTSVRSAARELTKENNGHRQRARRIMGSLPQGVPETGDPGPESNQQKPNSGRGATPATAADKQSGGVSTAPAGSASPSRASFASPSARA
jgi:hypothetical protein